MDFFDFLIDEMKRCLLFTPNSINYKTTIFVSWKSPIKHILNQLCFLLTLTCWCSTLATVIISNWIVFAVK